jgi:hypothetical protein
MNPYLELAEQALRHYRERQQVKIGSEISERSELSQPKLLQRRDWQMFEYRLSGTDNWLVLFSVRPDDEPNRLSRDLAVRFGCPVEVRLRRNK